MHGWGHLCTGRVATAEDGRLEGAWGGVASAGPCGGEDDAYAAHGDVRRGAAVLRSRVRMTGPLRSKGREKDRAQGAEHPVRGMAARGSVQWFGGRRMRATWAAGGEGCGLTAGRELWLGLREHEGTWGCGGGG